jgi:zinc transporter 1
MNEKPKSVEDGIKGAVDKKKAEKDKKAAAAKSAGSQMNMRGVFLHVLADALGSVVVIISALIMWLTEWEYKKYVDPALSLVLVCLMMKVRQVC